MCSEYTTLRVLSQKQKGLIEFRILAITKPSLAASVSNRWVPSHGLFYVSSQTIFACLNIPEKKYHIRPEIWYYANKQKEVRELCGLVPRRLWFGALCWHQGRRVGDCGTLGVGWAASWGSHEPVASCPWTLGLGSRLFRTFIGQEEGQKAHPGKVERLSPSWKADAWDSFHCFQKQNEELGLIIDFTYSRRYYKPETDLLVSTVPMVHLKIGMSLQFTESKVEEVDRLQTHDESKGLGNMEHGVEHESKHRADYCFTH
ncbi:hypothetical protein EI555_008073 [Monodon monoceros]|uniref:Uncharacterized protein n=1 Tax=Monodon monoceros TaxID=40151 RepID=A0A4U1EGR4_MONMO|nr:hypothetical protein EI555_008073 [Monodon monoceros]